jgi:hypothetical protein
MGCIIQTYRSYAAGTGHLVSLEKSVGVLRVVLVGVFKEGRLVLYMY